MPKDYFNDPIERATGENFAPSPQSLMFERLVSNLQSTLDEEVFFDDSDWADGFDWDSEAEAVWAGLAEDATMLATFRTRRPADRLLCRAAGVIHRAIRAGSAAELEAARIKLEKLMQKPAEPRIHFMLEEAGLCLEQMADRAKAEGCESDLGLPPEA
ncbi:hypothetical protein [uncultured Sulfitobacter sp.]|jgi:hypothetical protein|uniref:hypothetical protein n=1 Tax=uncultured Sulfitobacter sp. TaxID=191468 RepID=UPI0030D9CF2B